MTIPLAYAVPIIVFLVLGLFWITLRSVEWLKNRRKNVEIPSVTDVTTLDLNLEPYQPIRLKLHKNSTPEDVRIFMEQFPILSETWRSLGKVLVPSIFTIHEKDGSEFNGLTSKGVVTLYKRDNILSMTITFEAKPDQEHKWKYAVKAAVIIARAQKARSESSTEPSGL